MHHPDKPLDAGFKLVLVILAGAAVGQLALADTKKLAAVPAAPVSTPEAAVEPGSTSAAAVEPGSKAEAQPAPLTGPEVYKEICIACHTPPGLGGAPALGDSDAWAARVAQGIDTLIDHALHGYSGSTGIMPRKGGRLDLSDEEIVGAVQYMIEQAQQ